MNESPLIINFLIAFGACQAFFIAFIILRSRHKTLFKKLFVLFLIIEGITLFERLLVETNLIESIPHLLGISYPISFIKPPLILLMALAITEKHFHLQRKHFLHFIPFALMLVFNIPFYFLSANEKLETVRIFMENIPTYQSFAFYFSLSFFVYIGIYIFSSIGKLNQFKRLVINNGLVNWFYVILLLYTSFLILHLIYFVVQPLNNYQLPYANQISMLIMTFIIQSVAYKLINQSKTFHSTIPDLSDLEKRKHDEKLIIDKFEIDKIYLDDTLNLKRFSESVALPDAYVSEIVNQKFNCSFKNLVAKYRLKEAKSIMKNKTETKVTLIEIAYDAGFNNKVSFFRTFKEYEGISPSEYFENLKNGNNCLY